MTVGWLMRLLSGRSVDEAAEIRSVGEVDEVDEVFCAKTAVYEVVVAIYRLLQCLPVPAIAVFVGASQGAPVVQSY